MSVVPVQSVPSFGPRFAQALWFSAGGAIAFLTPFVLTSVLDLHHDLYYGIYFAVAIGFVASYVRASGTDIRGLLLASWQWSLAIGAFAAAFVVANVLSRDSTPHPGGVYFAFSIGWRGVAYGVVDAILLTAFPAAVALNIVGGKLAGFGTRARFAGLSLGLTLILTAVYHLGYEQFRDDGVAAPEVGNTIISPPTVLTGNPIGSIVAHAAMHVTAVTHAYETDTFLPPQTFVE